VAENHHSKRIYRYDSEMSVGCLENEYICNVFKGSKTNNSNNSIVLTCEFQFEIYAYLCKGGRVVRALACELILLVHSLRYFEGFTPGTPVFLPRY